MQILTPQGLIDFRMEDLSKNSKMVALTSSRIGSITAACAFMLNNAIAHDVPPVNFLEEASRVFAVPSEQIKWFFAE